MPGADQAGKPQHLAEVFPGPGGSLGCGQACVRLRVPGLGAEPLGTSAAGTLASEGCPLQTAGPGDDSPRAQFAVPAWGLGRSNAGGLALTGEGGARESDNRPPG